MIVGVRGAVACLVAGLLIVLVSLYNSSLCVCILFYLFMDLEGCVRYFDVALFGWFMVAYDCFVSIVCCCLLLGLLLLKLCCACIGLRSRFLVGLLRNGGFLFNLRGLCS